MAKEDIDMIDAEDSGDELESAGMHLIGDSSSDEDDDAADAVAPVVVVSVEEDEVPKDGLAELDELEKSLDAERNGVADEVDDDEGV